MFTFLHAFHPQPILLSLGPINIRWYGLLVVLGMMAALFVAVRLAKFYGINAETIIDLGFWLIIFGLIGARFYDVILELPYYLKYPLAVFKVWQGGLAIHGAIFAGLITVYLFARKNNLNFWLTASIIAPGLALAMAIGRWGNYFNQELFGLPTNLPWGIPIDFVYRPTEYLSFQYFHPTFLYESIGNFLIFLILLLVHRQIIKKQGTDETPPVTRYVLCVMCFLILYSVLRFSLEFIKIDPTPIILGLRWPQAASLIIIIVSLVFLFSRNKSAKTLELS